MIVKQLLLINQFFDEMNLVVMKQPLQGDSIATRSIRYVEFRISSTDVVKRERHPYVMDKFRFDKFALIKVLTSIYSLQSNNRNPGTE